VRLLPETAQSGEVVALTSPFCEASGAVGRKERVTVETGTSRRKLAELDDVLTILYTVPTRDNFEVESSVRLLPAARPKAARVRCRAAQTDVVRIVDFRGHRALRSTEFEAEERCTGGIR
jgi:hypothetical protein